VLEDRKAKQYISDIKFSPDGKIFVMTSYDGKMYVHDGLTYVLLRAIELPSKTKGLQRIDFSTDGMFMRVSSEREELYHYRVADGEIVTSPPAMRDVNWKTSTCPYTWMTQGRCRIHCTNIVLCIIIRQLFDGSHQNNTLIINTTSQCDAALISFIA
jgi:WD40 repeat protein